MARYRVTDLNGHEVTRGDKITDFRGEDTIFDSVSRGPEYSGMAKVIVTNDLGNPHAGREYYASVFTLSVEALRDDDHG